MYQIRPVDKSAGDLSLISEWWSTHEKGRLPLELLPPTGFFVLKDDQPVAVVFLYLSVGVGVAFLEWAVSKPELSLKEARQAFDVLMDFTKVYLTDLDYGVIWANTLPGIARALKQHGFTSQGNRHALYYCRSCDDVDGGCHVDNHDDGKDTLDSSRMNSESVVVCSDDRYIESC